MLNGYPLRLVVPGYYGTYWVKHLNEITVIDSVFDGFWMKTAYRIPDNDCACIEPGTAPKATVPIGRFNVRSFITSLADGAKVKAGQTDPQGHRLRRRQRHQGGRGLDRRRQELEPAKLGQDLGRYSFREWTAAGHAGGRRARNQGPRHQQRRQGATADAAVEPRRLHAQRDRNHPRDGGMRGMTMKRPTLPRAALGLAA